MPVRAEIAKQQFRSDENLRDHASVLGYEVDQNINATSYKTEDAKETLDGRNHAYKAEYSEENSKVNLRRLASKSIDDVQASWFGDESAPNNDLLPQKR